MEDCHLVLTIPGTTDLEVGAAFTMHPQSHLEIFRLRTDDPIDPGALTYRTRPRGVENIATVHAHAISGGGDVAVYRFPCPPASLHTFEVACAEGFPECVVDAWSSQNTMLGKSTSRLWTVVERAYQVPFFTGIIVIQYPTI